MTAPFPPGYKPPTPPLHPIDPRGHKNEAGSVNHPIPVTPALRAEIASRHLGGLVLDGKDVRQTKSSFWDKYKGPESNLGIPHGEVAVVGIVTTADKSVLISDSHEEVVPYSMYLEDPDIASPEDIIGRLKHHVALLERSFSMGQVLLSGLHLDGIDALVKAVKTYHGQLPASTFASLFDE